MIHENPPPLDAAGPSLDRLRQFPSPSRLTLNKHILFQQRLLLCSTTVAEEWSCKPSQVVLLLHLLFAFCFLLSLLWWLLAAIRCTHPEWCHGWLPSFSWGEWCLASCLMPRHQRTLCANTQTLVSLSSLLR